jgi:hypothetical protein
VDIALKNKRRNKMDLEEVSASLRKRGFDSHVCTREEAVQFVLDAAKSSDNVGWGGSETIKQLDLRDEIVRLGKEIRDHRTDCDLFLLSANALLTDGRIVNIDGRGNRISASIYGPKRVIYIIGKNKIVSGGLEEGIARIKKFACPPNAKRLGKNTPCALTGVCGDCDSPDRICKVTAIFDRVPTATPTSVLLVDENLGY